MYRVCTCIVPCFFLLLIFLRGFDGFVGASVFLFYRFNFNGFIGAVSGRQGLWDLKKDPSAHVCFCVYRCRPCVPLYTDL